MGTSEKAISKSESDMNENKLALVSSELKDEEWKPVPGYEGYYSVSNQGRVYSERSGIVLKPKHSKGYLRVGLSVDGFVRNTPIHRLVALAFIPNPDNKPTVNHINENKEDNRVENLEWATTREQNIHGTRIERAMAHTDWIARNMKTDYKAVAAKHNYHEMNRSQMKPVLQFSREGFFIAQYNGVAEAARKVGVLASHICCCLKGRRKSCGGYQWKYA